jgi:competence protein ComEA
MPVSWIFWVLAALTTTQVAMAQAAPTTKVAILPSSKSTVAYPVDINHADLKNLTHIKGVGKKRAKAIIQYRQAHGDFKSVNDLAQVKGFTQKRLQTLLEKNQGKITTHP